MSSSWDLSAPPFPLTASFTANWQTQASQRLVVKLSLTPGSYQISLLPDLMVLTTATGTRTADDVSAFSEEVLISSATIMRAVNWWDASGVFHAGENLVARLQSSPDTLATQAMEGAGWVSNYGAFEYYSATATIEPAKTITYASGARDEYTADYSLVVYGWNLSYSLLPQETEVPMSGRFLVTVGNPTGQRTQAWGGDWLNVQSLFESYQPPVVPPPTPAGGDLDPRNLPAELVWSSTPDAHGVQSPHIADSAEATWWDNFGKTVLSGYVSQALTALKPLADASGYFKLGAALDIVNAATTAAGVRDFLNGVVARIWAHDVQGMQLILNPNTTSAQVYAWGAEDARIHQEIQQGSKDQVIASVLDKPIPGGGMLYSVWTSLSQKVSQEGSFSLGVAIPGWQVGGGARTDVVSGGTDGDSIQTGSGADAVLGYEGNDVIATGDGADRLWGGAGDDQLDGGAGVDTALYAGAMAGYAISKSASGFAVQGAEGSDTLVHVERLMFSDTNVALDIDGIGGQAYRLYQAAFNRTPDRAGLGYWIAALDHGADLRDVARGFVDSAEFRSPELYGPSPTNAQLVTKYYENVLHRAPEPGGYAYWLGVLDRHQDTPAGVLANISESAENQAGVIGVIGNGFAYTPYG